MGRKLYKPILKDGYHLVDSSENSNRVRGQARDKENKNPDIVEWEAVDAVSYKEMGEALAVAIIAAAAAGAGLYYVINNKVVPWWKSAALPWVKRRSDYVTSFFKGEKKYKSVQRANTGNKDKNLAEMEKFSNQIDEVFEKMYIDMSETEAKQHLLKIIFHMLEIANEIRIMSNAHIKRHSESEEDLRLRIDASEKFLVKKLAYNLDLILSNPEMYLDEKTSNDLFNLLGGGLITNGEYIPVEAQKVYDAILAQED